MEVNSKWNIHVCKNREKWSPSLQRGRCLTYNIIIYFMDKLDANISDTINLVIILGKYHVSGKAVLPKYMVKMNKKAKKRCTSISLSLLFCALLLFTRLFFCLCLCPFFKYWFSVFAVWVLWCCCMISTIADRFISYIFVY